MTRNTGNCLLLSIRAAKIIGDGPAGRCDPNIADGHRVTNRPVRDTKAGIFFILKTSHKKYHQALTTVIVTGLASYMMM
jgi:hypothetical protein